MRCLLQGCCVLGVLGLGLSAQAPVPPDSLLRLVDLDGLPLLQPGVTCRQFASTDPTGRGTDHGHFLRRNGDAVVLAEMEGPGVVARLWSANAAGRLRVFLDGEVEPRIDGPFQDLFTGKLPPFCEPFAVHASGGWISYFPIPYAKSCRIEVAGLERPEALYYQVQYLTYPVGTPMRTFTRELPPDEKLALGRALQAWHNPGRLPQRPLKERGFDTALDIPAGEAKWIESDGPATLVELRLSPANPSPEVLRGLLLEIAFDGGAPTVRAPLGDFFGCGFGRADVRGLLLGWRQDTGYCLLPMPYRKQLRLSLRNTTAHAQRVSVGALSSVGEPAAAAGVLHAEFRCTDRVGSELYEFASIRGPGKYVGITQALQGVGDLWYLEGNEQFFVDGERTPSILGTGTEDFYNGGWYWDRGPFSLPLHGLGEKAEWTTNRTTPWRLQLPDAVPFTTGLLARIEHGSRNEVRDPYYSSVVYWYGPPSAVRAVPDAELKLPRLWVTRPKGFVPAANLRWAPSPAVAWKTWEELTETHRGLDRPLFQAFPVSYVIADGAAVDPRLAVMPRGAQAVAYHARIDVPFADRYDLQLRLRHPWGLADVQIDGVSLLGAGRRHRDFELDLLGSGAPEELSLGAGALAAGERTITFVAAAGPDGKTPALDSLRLLPIAPFVRTWWIGPPVAADARGTVEDAVADEARFAAADFDPKANGWKQVAADGDSLDLNHHVSRQAPVFGYLLVFVHSPVARTARALLGSDDGVRVWANGALVWSHALHRPLAPDQDTFDVPLQQGWNRLLLKVKNDDGGYGVMLRLADPDGALRFAHAPDAR
jgi:hypothetical protein